MKTILSWMPNLNLVEMLNIDTPRYSWNTAKVGVKH